MMRFMLYMLKNDIRLAISVFIIIFLDIRVSISNLVFNLCKDRGIAIPLLECSCELIYLHQESICPKFYYKKFLDIVTLTERQKL